MNKENIKLGIIGVGGIALNIHIPILSKLEGVKIVAVCDHDPKRVKHAAALYSIDKTYTSYIEMLKECKLDAVYILTQPEVLFRIANCCLDNGLHVFMEKPMGITVFQAETLYKKAIEKNKLLHVGFNRRFIPLVVKTVETLKSLTDINYIDGCFFKDSGASFYDGCASSFECDVVHVIDLVRHIANSMAKSSSLTAMRTADSDVTNAFVGSIVFENGILGSIRANYSAGARVHKFEIHGKNASAYINLGFADAVCNATIVCTSGTGTLSLSSKGANEVSIIKLDANELAKSDSYQDYYGYRDEDICFIKQVEAFNGVIDTDRLDEDFETMKLTFSLLSTVKER